MSWILQRRYPPEDPGPNRRVQLEPENFVYDVVECTHDKPRPPIEAIFVQDVPGFAYKGEMRFVDRDRFRRELLALKLADYASDFNKKWHDVQSNYVNGVFVREGLTSAALDVINYLQKLVLLIEIEYSPADQERVLVNSQLISLLLKLHHKIFVHSDNITIDNEFGGFSEPGEHTVTLTFNQTYSLPLKINIVTIDT